MRDHSEYCSNKSLNAHKGQLFSYSKSSAETIKIQKEVIKIVIAVESTNPIFNNSVPRKVDVDLSPPLYHIHCSYNQD